VTRVSAAWKSLSVFFHHSHDLGLLLSAPGSGARPRHAGWRPLLGPLGIRQRAGASSYPRRSTRRRARGWLEVQSTKSQLTGLSDTQLTRRPDKPASTAAGLSAPLSRSRPTLRRRGPALRAPAPGLFTQPLGRPLREALREALEQRLVGARMPLRAEALLACEGRLDDAKAPNATSQGSQRRTGAFARQSSGAATVRAGTLRACHG
jgi:hypothetical protein